MKNHTINKNHATSIVLFVLLAVVILCRPISNIPGISGTSWSLFLTKTQTLLYFGLYIYWTFTIYRRIIHNQTRNLLMSIGLLICFWLAIRSLKWFYVFDADASRFLWYLYYLPMNLIPTLGVYTAMSVGKPESWRLPKWVWGFVGISLLLTVGILLNDRHQLAFRFLTPVWNEDDIQHGPVYWCNIAWEIVCGLATEIILFVKCRLPHKKPFLLLPVLSTLCLILYGIAYFFRIPLFMLTVGDITAFLCLFYVATIECCIWCGLIRSNTGYDELFRKSGLHALIADENHSVVLSSEGSRIPTVAQMESAEKGSVYWENGLRLSAAPIKGGMCFGRRMCPS